MGRSVRRMSSGVLAVLVALVAVVSITAGPQALAAVPPYKDKAGCPASSGPIVIAPGSAENLNWYLRSLCPGDTLLLKPGTYCIGQAACGFKGNPNPLLRAGTAAKPITVRAYDPKRPPLLVGHLMLNHPDYWRLSHLRIQGSIPKLQGLTISGGGHWSVTSTEVFGANRTQALANVHITGDGGQPDGFTFADNCVHDAGNSLRMGVTTQHNIYVNFRGSTRSGGVIARNVIFGHPNGSGIKLGLGGEPRALGPWGVRVMFNTIVNGAHQILLHGNVRKNTITGNILGASSFAFGAKGRLGTTGIYGHAVVGTANVATHNYMFGTKRTVLNDRSAKKIRLGADNKLRANPGFTSGPGVVGAAGCTNLRAASAKAAAYGYTGTGRW